ncbi:beta strand repeat-containing protein [Methylobacterium oryzihabitans]|uniref:Autotransporter domain-containing protein n=1 Tax=Methylobacterium oryzihabitans TaxID=2499852 RepID=A0A3S2VAJ5_9HYPH|nr:autotransporter-associated beta strand repeat-containing protein [Methylobacterium oryzihabitans]RVU19818.1 hypothetical protein EOE48_07705 [Methylobacterium oryzihabitans]
MFNPGFGTFTNAGAILGGTGGAGGGTARADGGSGGAGVVLSNTNLFTNLAASTVTGGAGGVGGTLGFFRQAPRTTPGASGDGGAGLSGATGASVANAGTIRGGTGGAGAVGVPGFVEITGPSGATVATGGTGGTGGAGGRGGAGVDVAGVASFRNTGTLSGGAGGTGGTGGAANGGGESGFDGPPEASGGAGGTGGTGGTGLRIGGGTGLSNAGTVRGGSGGQGGDGGLSGFGTLSRSGNGGQGGAGGIGAQVAAPDFTNSRLIVGGVGGAGGAFGAAGASGASGPSGVAGSGGTGGTGLVLDGTTRLTNAPLASISGGNGGASTTAGGAGGIGVFAPSGGTLINAGTISGGGGFQRGSTGAAGSGPGGTAIVGADLAIVNSGTIAVGDGATGPAGPGTGRAISFTGGLNSLTLTGTSQIDGTVAAFSANDRLVLSGARDGNFSAAAIGTQYQNFGVFQKVDAGVWTLTGTTAAATPWQVLGGTLAIGADGSLGASSGGILLDGGTLQITAPLSTNRTVTLGAAGGTIDTRSRSPMTAGGPFVGTGGLTVTGGGRLTLSGANTYTGETTVDFGTLTLAAGGSLASSVTTLVGGRFSNAGTVAGSLTNASSATNDGTIAGPVVNSGTFVNRGTAGALTSTAGSVTSTGTFTGAATITGGSLVLGSGSLLDGALTNGATVTAQGRIAGPVTNLAGASFTLSGPLADLTALSNAGTVSLAGNGLGIGTLTGEGGVIQNASGTAATLTLGAGSSGSVLQDGVGGGALSVAKVGAGPLTLTGANTYSGATTIAAGTLALAGSGTLAASSGLTLAGGATFDIAGLTDGGLAIRSLADDAAGGTGTVALGANRLTLTDASGRFSGPITGTGGLTLAGGSQTLTGASSYTGATTIAAGTLALATGGSLASSVTTLVPGIFSNAGTVAGGLTNAGTATNDGTIAGPVVNSGTFVNRGTAGALTSTAGSVTNTGTFTGAATITGGSLVLGSGSLLDGALTNGATVTAQGRIAGPVTNLTGANFTLSGPLADLTALSNAGTVSLAGNGLAVGTLTGEGGVIQNASGTAATLTLGSGSSGGSVLQDGAGGGALSVAKVGAGTLTLTGANTYSGGTAFNGGTLLAASDASLGAATGALSFGGGTLATGATFTTGRTLTLGAAGGTLAPEAGGSLTLTGIVAGSGGLTVGGTGRVVLTGTGSYGGGTTVNAGATLQLGDGGTTGAIAGNVLANGTLTLDRSDRVEIAGIISGSGTLNQSGPGLTALTGSNGPGAQFTGTATVTAGTLAINGTFGDTAGNRAVVTVGAGGTLLGSGTIAGSVAVNGGTVSAGNSPGTLTVAGNYTLAPGSTSLFEFGSPGIVGGTSNDLIVVSGDLRLGGTLGLVSANAATVPPVSGAYRLFNVGGTVSGAFDAITTPGPGTAALVYTNIPNQVNALLTNGNQSVQFWDGTDTTGAAAGGQGGTGTWSAGGTNWTRLPGGQINDLWRSGVGLFGGSAGTVTVAGAQAVQGLQFTVDGYRLDGSGTLTLTGDPFTTLSQSFVTVDTGVSATIATALTGQNAGIGLRKLGDGTLTLSGIGTYTGATTIAAGTLALATGGSLASSVTTLVPGIFSNAGTVAGGLTNAGTATNDGTIAGPVVNSGTFVNRGTAGALTSTAGTVTSTGTLLGAATITGGSLMLGSGSLLDGALTNGATVTAQGRIAGPVTNLTGASFTLSGPLADLTALSNAGTVSLAGNGLGIGTLTGEGGVIQNASGTAATLTLGAGSSGSVLQDGAGGGALSMAKVGAGTLTLVGDNTYSGGTRVAGGVLALGRPGAAGTGTIALDAGTRLAFLGSGYTVANALRLTGPAAATIDSGPGTVALSGPISGAGALEKAGLGTLVVTGSGTHTGATAVAAGILQVDGAFTGSSILTVGPGAGLTGTGRTGAVAVQSGGFVAPGNAANPTGTLTAEGPVVLQGGATLATTLSLTAASQLVTASTAAIASGGILQITPSALTYSTPVRLPILVAGAGLTGQFSTVTFTAPVRGLQPTVGYDANTAFLQFGESAPDGPTPPGPDLTSAIAAAQGLARDRIGAFVTQRVLGSVLTGFNQQISCGDCFSGFGMAGSYSVGAQGRKALTEELIAIGGFAYTGYDSGRVRVSGAPIFAGLLRYDPAGFGAARPFVDVGGLFAPSQRSTYSRIYSFGTMTGQGTGQIASTGASVFARVGTVARLSPQDEIAAAVEYSRGWQFAGAYNEGLLAPNPYALASTGGTDVINIAKLGGQYTHLFGSAIETQINLGVAHGFDLRSGLRGTVAGMPFTTPIKDLTWAEYGARVSYRLQRNLALDAFILGTLGPRPVGDTIHGGASVRYAF